MLLVPAAGATASTKFAAACTASENVGDLVRTDGAGGVVKVDIDAASIEVAVGIVISKPSSITCVIQSSGPVSGSFTAGAFYYVGIASNAVTPRPAAPGSGLRSIQYIGQALTATRLLLSITKPIRMRA